MTQSWLSFDSCKFQLMLWAILWLIYGKLVKHGMYKNEQYNLFRSSNSWIFRGLILLSLTTYLKCLTVYRLCIYCIPLNIVFLLKGEKKSGGSLGGGGDSHLIPYQSLQKKCSCLKASNRVTTMAASPFSIEPCAVLWLSCDDDSGGRINSFFLPDVPEQFSDCVNIKPTPAARSNPQGQASLSSTLWSRTKWCLCLVSRPAQWGRVSVVIVCRVLKAPHSVEPRPPVPIALLQEGRPIPSPSLFPCLCNLLFLKLYPVFSLLT